MIWAFSHLESSIVFIGTLAHDLSGTIRTLAYVIEGARVKETDLISNYELNLNKGECGISRIFYTLEYESYKSNRSV